MADSKAEVKKKDETVLMLMPGEITDRREVAPLEAGKELGLGVPTDEKVNDYFRTPGALAIERKKRGSYGNGDQVVDGYKE